LPHSSLSEPAQRPARSSSSGLVGRVHEMHPIERLPASWRGLYGMSFAMMYVQTSSSLQSASGWTFQTPYRSERSTFRALAREGDWSRRMPETHASYGSSVLINGS